MDKNLLNSKSAVICAHHTLCFDVPIMLNYYTNSFGIKYVFSSERAILC